MRGAAAKLAAQSVPVSGNMTFCLPAWLVMYMLYMLIHVLCHMAIVSTSLKKTSLGADPHMAAHFPVQLFGFALLAYYGAGAWLSAMPDVDPGPGAYLFVGERIAMHMGAFQLYELSACIPSKRLRGKHYEFVGHHCITLLLSYLAYYYQAYHYWAPCFMGMSELSSIPLAVMDFFKQYKQVASQMPITNELCRVMFALLFLPIRGVYWPYSSIFFWKVSLAALESGSAVANQLPWVIGIFCVCNVLMTGLQWYWASLIVMGIVAKATGGEAPDAREGEEWEAAAKKAE